MKKLILLVAVALSSVMVNAQSRWSVTPEAGLTVNKENEGKTATTLGFKVGAGVLYQIKEAQGSRPSFGLKSGLYLLMQRGALHTWNDLYNNSGYQGGYEYDPSGGYGSTATGDETSPKIDTWYDDMTRYNLQLPIMAHWGFTLSDDIRLNLAVGPYVAVALGGTTSVYQHEVGKPGPSTEYNFNPFKEKRLDNGITLKGAPRFDWGGTASAGISVKRVSFQIGYDLAWGKYHKDQNDLRIRNHQVSFTFGYTL